MNFKVFGWCGYIKKTIPGGGGTKSDSFYLSVIKDSSECGKSLKISV